MILTFIVYSLRVLVNNEMKNGQITYLGPQVRHLLVLDNQNDPSPLEQLENGLEIIKIIK